MNRIIVSKLTDPFVNLALESFYFNTLGPESRLLFLYTNTPCIVIGRNQNPWKECNIVVAREKNIPVIRRRSGGGTVVHDLGNVNFCVQTPRTEFSRTKHIEMIVSELSRYGLSVNERHDIINKEGKKVSGSSFKIVRQRAYHHATMLLESNLDTLRSLLRKDPENGTIEGLGTDSVSSPVANAGVAPAVYVDAWVNAFKREYPVDQVENVSKVPEEVIEDALNMKQWEWNFGETPRFTHKLGPYEFEISKGRIVQGPNQFLGREYRNLDIGEFSKWI